MLTPEGVPGAIAEVFHDGRISIVPISDFTVPQGKTLQVWTLFDKEKGPAALQDARFAPWRRRWVPPQPARSAKAR